MIRPTQAAITAILAVFADLASAGRGGPGSPSPPSSSSCQPRFAWENAELKESAIPEADLSLFGFGDGNGHGSPGGPGGGAPKCKAFPGDPSWPSQSVWNKFNSTLGGALIKTVPLAAPCYVNWPQYNAAVCADITARWGDPNLHVDDPSSAMFPLYQGRTCLPTDDLTGSNCTLGGYAEYSVAVTKVSQIQLALNFARRSNLRLVVKNTGHDFADKSIGAGALSVWTHKLKDIQFLASYNCRGYQGPAFKLASGVETEEVYRAAELNNVTIVGGECRVSAKPN